MNMSSRFIKFIGGKNLLFGLLTLLLLGVVIMIYNKISFVFQPIFIILSTIVPPIILAFIAYYLLNPIVNLLEKVKINRLWGIIIIIIGFTGIVTGLLFVIIPIITRQVKEFAANFPNYMDTLSATIQGLLHQSIIEPYYDEAMDWIDTNLGDLPAELMANAGSAIDGVASVAQTITTIGITIGTFPFVLFFLLKDATKFKEYCLRLFPKKFRHDIQEILNQMDTQVGSYIRGQILVAFCIGVLLFIGYLIIGLDYAIILASVAAVTSVVPYLGPIIAITPAIIIAIVTSPWLLVKLAIVWAVVQFLEGHFISPNVMGKTMQIHPLTIIFVLLVAGKLFGVVGMILAIPGYALLKVLITSIFQKFKIRYNKFYEEGYEHEEIEQ